MDEALQIAIAGAPRGRRAGLAALFVLDERLGAVLRSTSEPLIGQMRLAWWRDALLRLDEAPPPAEPLLLEAARLLLPGGVSGTMLAGMVDGWEALLTGAGALTADATDAFAAARGGGLFAAAAVLLGTSVSPSLGEGWALADLALNLRDEREAALVRAAASYRFVQAFRDRYASAARPLGVLGLLSAFRLRDARPLADATNLIRFRLTGRVALEID